MSSSSLSNQALSNQESLWSCSGRNDAGVLSAPNRLQIPTANHPQQRSPVSSETEELLQSDLKKLSLHEQAKAMNDIRCAASALKEDPLMIDRLLAEFQREVERGKHPIYKKALKQDRSYVEDPGFRLMFLRAKMHDVKKAVEQMISFLSHKAKCFGNDKVASDITVDDLTPDDLRDMLSGFYHIQDGADSFGRKILHFLSTHPAKDLNSHVRILFYMCSNVLMPLYSVQTKGIVMNLYGAENLGLSDEAPNYGRVSLMNFMDFIACIPIRVSAFHYCINSERNDNPLGNVFTLLYNLKALPKYMRERSCVHRGSSIELQYQLAAYGIPRDTFPVDAGGNLRQGILNAWFHERMERQDSGSSSAADEEPAEEAVDLESADDSPSDENQQQAAIIIPPPPPRPYSDQDVLLGKGHYLQNRPGNIAFRQFLKEHQQEHDSAPRFSRRGIARRLTHTLRANGVRFWEETAEDVWTEASLDDAEKTVSQFFRSARKRNR